jgi:hypothetical protein
MKWTLGEITVKMSQNSQHMYMVSSSISVMDHRIYFT